MMRVVMEAREAYNAKTRGLQFGFSPVPAVPNRSSRSIRRLNGMARDVKMRMNKPNTAMPNSKHNRPKIHPRISRSHTATNTLYDKSSNIHQHKTQRKFTPSECNQ